MMLNVSLSSVSVRLVRSLSVSLPLLFGIEHPQLEAIQSGPGQAPCITGGSEEMSTGACDQESLDK